MGHPIRNPGPEETAMAHDTTTTPHAGEQHAPDGVEAVVPYMPIVLPIAGGILMLLLAFIAIYMA
ncbi:hypothetical protein C8245_05255 [Paracidovorax avenae]|nr:hypothetical protein C8245_05255 [Paracidovorax avenae]